MPLNETTAFPLDCPTESVDLPTPPRDHSGCSAESAGTPADFHSVPPPRGEIPTHPREEEKSLQARSAERGTLTARLIDEHQRLQRKYYLTLAELLLERGPARAVWTATTPVRHRIREKGIDILREDQLIHARVSEAPDGRAFLVFHFVGEELPPIERLWRVIRSADTGKISFHQGRIFDDFGEDCRTSAPNVPAVPQG